MNKFQKKVSGALYEISISDKWPDDYNALTKYKRSTDPPAYMIKMVLMYLAEGKLPRGGDKSEWEIPLLFKKKTWLICDWKRYAWNIYGPEDSQVEAGELESKLQATAKILDLCIQKSAKKEFAKGNISLHNQFYQTEMLYTSFCSKAKELLESKDPELKSTGRNKQLENYINIRLNKSKEIEYHILATTIFFYSHVEVILDACFSLGKRFGINFKEFRNLGWAERFKLYIRPDESNEINILFSQLLEIRKFYRNIPVHAGPTFFFHLNGFGLIPSSYERLLDPHMSYKLLVDKEEPRKIINTFEETINLFKSHSNTQYAYLYAQSGLPIHIEEGAINELKKHMDSLINFEEELHRRNEYQDALDNMCI